MLDLKQTYNVLSYAYNKQQRAHGESVCIVLVPPSEISEQFSVAGKIAEDKSPHHVTVGYLGTVPVELEDKVVRVVQNVCSQTKAFPVKLGKIGLFENEKEIVYHSTIKSRRLHKLHDALKLAFSLAQMPLDATYPTYTPHMTIEYVSAGSEPQHVPEQPPAGEWQADSVWIWGFEQPHLVFLK
jgi:2'-5' RNA ligase